MVPLTCLLWQAWNAGFVNTFDWITWNYIGRKPSPTYSDLVGAMERDLQSMVLPKIFHPPPSAIPSLPPATHKVNRPKRSRLTRLVDGKLNQIFPHVMWHVGECLLRGGHPTTFGMFLKCQDPGSVSLESGLLSRAWRRVPQESHFLRSKWKSFHPPPHMWHHVAIYAAAFAVSIHSPLATLAMEVFLQPFLRSWSLSTRTRPLVKMYIEVSFRWQRGACRCRFEVSANATVLSSRNFARPCVTKKWPSYEISCHQVTISTSLFLEAKT